MNSTLLHSRREAGALVSDVAAANRDFYRHISHKYDQYESCARDSFFQSMLQQDIDWMSSALHASGEPVNCLDCGGGTGNIALKLLRRGWKVTVVDISEDMLALLHCKCRESGHQPTVVTDSLEHFFETNTDQYDVITFGSVLHHLYSYESVLQQATRSVRPLGLIYTNFDPVRPTHPTLARIFESVDTLLAKITKDPLDVFPGIIRRLRKLTMRHHQLSARKVASPGDLAEFHAKTGIDDARLVRFFSERGFEVVSHSRYPYARNSLLRRLNETIRLVESFRLICRRQP